MVKYQILSLILEENERTIQMERLLKVWQNECKNGFNIDIFLYRKGYDG